MALPKIKPPAPTYLGPPFRSSGPGNKPIHRIVLHGTVSPTRKGQARETAAYFRSKKAGGSAHYVVDPGEVVQTCHDSTVAWHAPPNSHSLGIELCDWVGDAKGALPLSRWDDADHRAMLDKAAHLTAQLCLAYDVPVQLLGPVGLRAGKRGICEHSDVSQAWHQSSHWDLGNFPRQRFLALVKAHAKALERGTAAPKVAAKPSRITKARDLLQQAVRATTNPTRRKRVQTALHNLPER